MKNLIYLFACLALVSSLAGCYDQSVLDSKDGVATLPTITGLTYTLSGNTATLNWGIPSNISPSVQRPLNVVVQVNRWRPGVTSPVRVALVTLSGEPTTYTYTIPADEGEYHAIIKLSGNVVESQYGLSPTIYSLGQTVILK